MSFRLRHIPICQRLRHKVSMTNTRHAEKWKADISKSAAIGLESCWLYFNSIIAATIAENAGMYSRISQGNGHQYDITCENIFRMKLHHRQPSRNEAYYAQ